MGAVSVRLENVHKNFGNVAALDGLNMEIEQGQIIGLLGHNGAGKTTTLRIILGLLNTNQGIVEVFGRNPLEMGEELRRKTGVLSEDTGLYESLTVYDNLKFFGEIYGCKKLFYENRIDTLLKEFDIFDMKNSVIKDFSLGMKKKVALIRTVLHCPQLVLLDEPTNGLDPVSIQKFHTIIKEMAQREGTTFVITTHNLDEVRKICDCIVIVKKGKNIFNKNLHTDDLSDICETKIRLLSPVNENYERIQGLIKKADNRVFYTMEQDTIILKTIDKGVISSIITLLCKADLPVYEAVMEEFDLEKVYMQTEEGEQV